MDTINSRRISDSRVICLRSPGGLENRKDLQMGLQHRRTQEIGVVFLWTVDMMVLPESLIFLMAIFTASAM